jgi:hypothetical protein
MNLHLRHLITENLEKPMDLVIKLQKSSSFELVQLILNINHGVGLTSGFNKKILDCVEVQKVAHYSVIFYFINPFLDFFSEKIEFALTEHCDKD